LSKVNSFIISDLCGALPNCYNEVAFPPAWNRVTIYEYPQVLDFGLRPGGRDLRERSVGSPRLSATVELFKGERPAETQPTQRGQNSPVAVNLTCLPARKDVSKRAYHVERTLFPDNGFMIA